MANAELTASFRVRTCVYIQLHTWKHQCLKVCILITKDGTSEARKLDHNWVRRASKKDSVKELTLGLTPNELQAQVAPLTCCTLQGRKMLTEAHACSQLGAHQEENITVLGGPKLLSMIHLLCLCPAGRSPASCSEP